jgi:hypothetical protein
MEPEAMVGHSLPHVTLTTLTGGQFSYTDIWQREQMLLVLVPSEVTTPWARLVEALEAPRERLREMDTVLVISSEAVAGLEAPAAVVADRWGEITHASLLRVEEGKLVPDVETLITWVEATLHRCPECEGEAR